MADTLNTAQRRCSMLNMERLARLSRAGVFAQLKGFETKASSSHRRNQMVRCLTGIRSKPRDWFPGEEHCQKKNFLKSPGFIELDFQSLVHRSFSSQRQRLVQINLILPPSRMRLLLFPVIAISIAVADAHAQIPYDLSFTGTTFELVSTGKMINPLPLLANNPPQLRESH